ncbi:NAD-dependent protein deacetylase hst4 [Penicillium angulare]|uniref:NAD-dependent protein deacetylase hst4 n=1 Tax=Penicillium angulare TaxID=116970 RepID=UPI00253F8CA7|nr:NAD-dependent protein deacetylase hst4 [Penicillium angulare]KAJ5279814.1 NAD-dependent protein deacetylase hst4 [Penicillium angulare]
MNHEVSDCSDLSSLASSPRSSPEPAARYLTPSSSQEGEDSIRQDCPPAKKRRRNPLPKERTTQYLKLSQSSESQKDQAKLLVETLRHQKDIVVIAGAGISTSAGIPDFRSTDGLFKSLQKKHNLKASGKLLFDAAVYQDDALTAPFHELVRSLKIESEKTKPTKFHQMLARLGKENRLKRLYTQNIDGLETSMVPLQTEVPLNVKGRWPVTIQLHGSIQKMVCQKCRSTSDLDPSIFVETDPPECGDCAENDRNRRIAEQRSHGVGRLRPRIVLYNEHNPDEEAITSVMNADVKSRPRVLIVAGTSLKIPGVRRLVKSLCTVIRTRKDGVTMFINNEPPVGKEFENCFDLIVQGNTDEVADLVALKNWEDCTPYQSLLPEPVFGLKPETDSETEFKLAVVITPKKKRTIEETGLLTPSASNDEKPNTKKVGKLANPASKGRNLKDMLGSAKTTAPAQAARKPAAAPKKRAPKTAAKPTKQITNFGTVGKSATAPANATKKTAGGKALAPVVMFPNLPKNADASGKVVEGVEATPVTECPS